MKLLRRQSPLLLGALLGLLAQPLPVLACSVCYGEPDSPMSRGLTWGITALAGIVLLVLGGVVAFFIQSNRRALAHPTPAAVVATK